VHAFSSDGNVADPDPIGTNSGVAAHTSQEMIDCANNGGTWIQP
jgi:hypothetical protein